MSGPLAAGARTWLFVPGDRPDRFAGARRSGADLVIVDLEDAVTPDRRPEAREAVSAALETEPGLVVRMNAAHTRDAEADLAMLDGFRGRIAAVVAAKAEEPEIVAALAARLDVPVVALVESAVGILRCTDIARAAGVVRLAFGAIDFALDVDARADDDVLAHPRSALVLASRAAGLAGPVDTPSTSFRDLGLVAAEARTARRFGMGGKLCIHPAQVPVVREAFAPTEAEIAEARAVLGAAEGDGAASYDGRMIDRPVLERARRVLLAAAVA